MGFVLRAVKSGSLCCLSFLLLFIGINAHSAVPSVEQAITQQCPQKNIQPRLSLVLSGGGARGAAHVGVLKVLERERVPVDMIFGTSMGSIVGALYASGLSPEAIENYFVNAPWQRYVSDEGMRKHQALRRKREDINFVTGIRVGIGPKGIILPKGLNAAHHFQADLQQHLYSAKDIPCFDDLVIPLRIAAARIEDGELTVFRQGDLVKAVRASMAIPGILAPVQIDGVTYVDGGVASNLPVDLALQANSEHIIAIDISTPPQKQEELTNLFSVVNQMTSLLTWKNTKLQRSKIRENDLLLEPDLDGIGTFDTAAIAEAVKRGEQAAEENLEYFKQFSLDEKQWQRYRSHFSNEVPDEVNLRNIVLTTDTKVDTSILKTRLRIDEKQEANYQSIKESIHELYGLDIFDKVEHKLQQNGDADDLYIHAVKKSSGPNFLQFGLQAEDHFNGENRYELGLSFIATEIESVNGEWITEIRLGEDLKFNSQLRMYNRRFPGTFLAPIYRNEKDTIRLYDNEGVETGRISVALHSAGVALGHELSNAFEVKLGVDYVDAVLRHESGALSAFTPGRISFQLSESYLEMTLDTLDNVDFPSHGVVANVRYALAKQNFDDDDLYNSHAGEANWVGSWGNQVFALGGLWGASFDGEEESLRLHNLGGFLRLSGLNRDELSGYRMGLARIVTYHRLADDSFLPWYIGGSLEAGNVWDKTDDVSIDSSLGAGSLFVGARTLFGPMYLGAGFAEGGRHSLFFYLGRTF